MRKRVEIVTDWVLSGFNIQNVIFSDEKTFNFDGPDNFMSWENISQEYIIKRNKRQMGGGSLMIHGMVAYNGCIFLSVVRERIRVYVEHLKKTFSTLKERYTQYIFQQDNALAHTSKLVHEFFVK